MPPSETAQWITFLTVIAGFVWQGFREWRQRRWDKQDRAELAAKVASEAALIAAQVAATTATLSSAIQENTNISTKAFHEANSVNMKIQDLHIETLALQHSKKDA